jgi:polyhydroxyalkanoate synthesis regulator phasin
MPTKTTKKEAEVPQPEKQENPLFDSLRKVMLASIGLIAITQEEAEKFIKKLIERGEIAEQDGKRIINEMWSRKKPEIEKSQDEVSKRVSLALDQLNLATKSDIESLKKEISELNKNLGEKKPE